MTIPPTVLSEILASKSSPAIIAALLNEAEAKHSSLPRHLNARRVYPFWKICQSCNQPFPAHTIEQANRNKTCGPRCAAAIISRAKTGEIRKTRIACAHCGKAMKEPPPSKRRKQVSAYCSRSCRAKVHAAHLRAFAANGKGKLRPGKGLGGSRNPAWKGGLTYRNRKGAYANQPIRYVRCPPPYLSMARRDGYLMEHRLLVAIAIGRPLSRIETVHHRNHRASDNLLSNLMLFATNADHKAFEGGAAIKPLWCGWCHSTIAEWSGVCVCPPEHSSLSATE